jgi:redox-sensitive bicupin YhaK (pirin superfamily)
MTNSVEANYQIRRARERYHGAHGWLDSHQSICFDADGDPKLTNWGALRIFNDDRVAPGAGFSAHPHRDMEIVSYVLEGRLEHRDDMGNHGIVEPGGVQYMSAGTGLVHSECNASRTESLRFVQMWVPPREHGLKPRYGQVNYGIERRLDRWLIIASGVHGIKADVAFDRDALFMVSRIEQGDLAYTTQHGRLAFLFVADGAIEVQMSGGADDLIRYEHLEHGDSVGVFGSTTMSIKGTAELVLWDVPPLP